MYDLQLTRSACLYPGGNVPSLSPQITPFSAFTLAWDMQYTPLETHTHTVK